MEATARPAAAHHLRVLALKAFACRCLEYRGCNLRLPPDAR